MQKIKFRILRYKPDFIDPPQYQDFDLEAQPHMTVLDCLEKIRLEQDSTLLYRHSCHHASCGTCACIINGTERLACTTGVHELNSDVITLQPLKGFTCRGDLVVDMQEFFEEFSQDWTCLKQVENPEPTRMPPGIKRFMRFENCIECGACVSACPANQKKKFIGPAALSAVNIELQKNPQKNEELISLAKSKRGANLCEQALNCSRVCPSGVYPARHISDLRRLLARRDS
jgi:succinate dehydrogenase / fumarate reductase iron-sulfur subunit